MAVRFRPLNEREKALRDTSCVQITDKQVTITSNLATAGEDKSFAFDHIFKEDSLQSEVWDAIGVPILAKAFSGYNGTIFAYGQTGSGKITVNVACMLSNWSAFNCPLLCVASGKTWSMQGAPGDESRGIIPRMTTAVFDQISTEKEQHPSMQFLVTASYFELYNEVIFVSIPSRHRTHVPCSDYLYRIYWTPPIVASDRRRASKSRSTQFWACT